jgi:hypothetical protein
MPYLVILKIFVQIRQEFESEFGQKSDEFESERGLKKKISISIFTHILRAVQNQYIFQI